MTLHYGNTRKGCVFTEAEGGGQQAISVPRTHLKSAQGPPAMTRSCGTLERQTDQIEIAGTGRGGLPMEGDGKATGTGTHHSLTHRGRRRAAACISGSGGGGGGGGEGEGEG